MNLDAQIESILLFKNEPVSIKDLASWTGATKEDVSAALGNLQGFYRSRGIVIVTDGESYSFGTSPENSGLIEGIQKDELSRELGRAGLETLSIVLYRGPVSRREIDHIRGVNSGFILRNLMIRGLIERTEVSGERSYSYKPTLKLLEYLGVTRVEDLPEYGTALRKLEEFSAQEKSASEEDQKNEQ